MIRDCSILLLIVFAQLIPMHSIASGRTVNIVPQPKEMVQNTGFFGISNNTRFSVENDEQALVVNEFLNQLAQASGIAIPVHINDQSCEISVTTDSLISNEGYQLDINPERIAIKVSTNNGLFYALQTIRLMLPAAIENNHVSNAAWELPAVFINDEPRFEYRGLMLDVSRYFIPKENVLRIIDCMAMLKLNKLHLHLVDDQGWRLEIKQYPRLTEVGAWRVDRTEVPFHSRRNAKEGESTPIGGFYTQDDIREMIAFADKRQVEIIPEIEMPAHTLSSLAAYPELACPVVSDYIGVAPGMANGLSDVIYCAGNDSVFSFLENIIDEVSALFPSKYIHLGGDEAVKTYWKKCPHCQARMKTENLSCEEELQGYFMNRVATYVRSKGKEVMGWDELTNSKLPEDVIIFGWQFYGKAALIAAEQGHRFVMTPARILYLIRYQGPQWFEPITYFGNNTLKDVYDYEPIQADWKPEYENLLMGVQGSLWTEFCDTSEDVDYLIFPRLAAVAATAWSQKNTKDWPLFLSAMDNYNEHIANKGIAYARSMYNIQHKVKPENGVLNVNLASIRPDIDIRYTLDGTAPTISSPLYTGDLSIDKSCTVSCATFNQVDQLGEVLVLPLLWNKATAKPIIGDQNTLLTNGVRGSLKHTDFEWSTWNKNNDISFTIDLLENTKINKVILGCITNHGMSIHKPQSVSVEVSTDNVNYKKVGELHFTSEQSFREGNYVDDLTFKLKKTKARYVRFRAQGPGNCPVGHVRAGSESRVLFDEIIIN